MKVLISFYSVKHSPAETKKKITVFVILLVRYCKYLEQYDVCFGVHLVTFSRLLVFIAANGRMIVNDEVGETME